MAKNKYDVTFQLAGVTAADAAGLAQLVSAVAVLMGVVVKKALVHAVQYLHKDGNYYPYAQTKKGYQVYKFVSKAINAVAGLMGADFEFLVQVPSGTTFAPMALTHERNGLGTLIPHWEDLELLPAGSRVWIASPDEEHYWYRVQVALAKKELRWTNSFSLELKSEPEESGGQ
jgi:hypothetical protein